MQQNEMERRKGPRRSAERDAQQMGTEPLPGEDHAEPDAAPSFFRAGEFEAPDPAKMVDRRKNLSGDRRLVRGLGDDNETPKSRNQ
jgi:hypothetical protein